MKFAELAKNRYSCRKFDQKKVEDEKLKIILEAGKLAPTARNIQPQRIWVIQSEDALSKLKECTPYHFNAPVALLVCYDRDISWKRGHDDKDSGEVDSSIVATHMMLQIAELGLGATWVGNFNSDAVRRLYELPANIIPVCILPLGYPVAGAAIDPRHNQRYPSQHTIIFC